MAVYGIQNAAGAYFGRPAISPDDLANPGFTSFMKAILASSANLGLGSYGLDDLRLFRHSFGDGGVFMEKDVLDHLADASKWDDPLRVTYPEYVAWLDYPVAIWMGDEFSAEEKNIALEFSRYVRTAPIGNFCGEDGLPSGERGRAAIRGRQPLCALAERGRGPRHHPHAGHRFMSRDVLDAILQFYRVDVLGRRSSHESDKQGRLAGETHFRLQILGTGHHPVGGHRPASVLRGPFRWPAEWPTRPPLATPTGGPRTPTPATRTGRTSSRRCAGRHWLSFSPSPTTSIGRAWARSP